MAKPTMSEAEGHSLEYFELDADFESRRSWFLGIPKYENTGKDADVWAFSEGHPLNFDSGLVVPIERHGDVTDIMFSHYFITYIQPRVGVLLEAFAGWDIQRVSARLETGEEIEILNVLTVLDCFDRERSEATYKGEKPNMVLKLRIQAEKAEGHHVFRLKDWRGPLIVSGLILEHLRRMGATGFVTRKVS
jgi:hypothetical protein